MKTVAWIAGLADRRGIARKMRAVAPVPGWLPAGCPDLYNGSPGMFICDEIAIGKGGTDRLAEIGFDVLGFNAARRPSKEKDSLIYANQRAWLAATFREYLVQGWIALPPDPLLLEELRVYSAFTNQSGKLQCVAKDDLKKILGRSPDRLDSVLMACCGGETDLNFARVKADGPVAF